MNYIQLGWSVVGYFVEEAIETPGKRVFQPIVKIYIKRLDVPSLDVVPDSFPPNNMALVLFPLFQISKGVIYDVKTLLHPRPVQLALFALLYPSLIAGYCDTVELRNRTLYPAVVAATIRQAQARRAAHCPDHFFLTVTVIKRPVVFDQITAISAAQFCYRQNRKVHLILALASVVHILALSGSKSYWSLSLKNKVFDIGGESRSKVG